MGYLIALPLSRDLSVGTEAAFEKSEPNPSNPASLPINLFISISFRGVLHFITDALCRFRSYSSACS